jgi:hypothetical protein
LARKVITRLRRRTPSSQKPLREGDVMARPLFDGYQNDRVAIRTLLTNPHYQQHCEHGKSKEVDISRQRHGRSSLVIDAQSQ